MWNHVSVSFFDRFRNQDLCRAPRQIGLDPPVNELPSVTADVTVFVDWKMRSDIVATGLGESLRTNQRSIVGFGTIQTLFGEFYFVVLVKQNDVSVFAPNLILLVSVWVSADAGGNRLCRTCVTDPAERFTE